MNLTSYQIAQIASLPIFNKIDIAELEKDLQRSTGVIEKCNKGSYAAHQNDPYNEFWILIEGELEASFQTVQGQSLLVETLRAPDLVASAIFFSEAARLPVSLLVAKDATLLKLDRSCLLRLFQNHLSMLEHYLMDSGNRVAFLAKKIRLLKLTSLKERIADYLLTQSRDQSTDLVDLGMPLERLSDLMGVARPSLSREMSVMQKDGLIKKEGKKVFLCNKDELLDLF